MAQNISAGCYNINEKEPTNFGDNNDNHKELINMQPGCGIYGNFEEQQNTKDKRTKLLLDLEEKTEIGLNEIQTQLDSTEQRKMNMERGKKLFYGDSYIMDVVIAGMGDLSKEKKQEAFRLFKSNEWQEDLSEILEQFVTNVEGENLDQIFKSGEENSLKILDALNIAFELQVLKVIEGKFNYPKQELENLLDKIKNGNPFEKIQYFEKIKQLVSSKEGIPGKKQAEAFSKVQKSKEQYKIEMQERFQKIQQQFSLAKEQQDTPKLKAILDELKTIKTDSEQTGGDIFQAGQLDSMQEEIKKAIQEQNPLFSL